MLLYFVIVSRPSRADRRGILRVVTALFALHVTLVLTMVLTLASALAFTASCSRRPDSPLSEIRISVPYEVDTLDPHSRNRLSNFAVVSHFYEPLVTTDANMTILPCLATRWDNPDLVTWIFHIRPGVRFHSGKRLEAEDVVYSFDRLLKSRDLGMSGYLLNIQRVRAIDPLTFEIRTSAPMSILLHKLRFVLIIPKGAVPASLQNEVDGTGPYALAGWTPGSEIRMVRNERTWGAKPPLKKVTFRLARSPDEALLDLTSNRSDLIQANSRNAEALSRKVPGVEVQRRPSIFVKFLSFDQAHETTPFCPGISNPFRNLLVRQAINLAIDRAALVARLSTESIPAWQAVPPSIFGFNPAIRQPTYQPERARALLAEAGLPKGFAVTLHVRNIFLEAAQIVAQMLGKVGIRVTVASLPDAEFFDVVSNHRASFFLSRFGCPTGDVSEILDNTVHTLDPARHLGAQNDGGFSNPALDRKIEESLQILDMSRRRPVLQEIMADMTNDLVWVPLYVDQDVYAIRAPFVWHPRADNFVLASEITLSR